MHLSVALLPSLAADLPNNVCVVIDVLRASSTLVTMFDRGCRTVVVTPDVASARARLRAGEILCGEQGGLPPPGFHHGNATAEFAHLDLAGRDAVFCTSNGTVALCAVAGAPAVLVGSLLNAEAVAHAAMKLARAQDNDVTFVCAGRDAGAIFGLDDALCAGALVDRVIDLQQSGGVDIHLEDSARAAHALYRPGTPAGVGVGPGRPGREDILAIFRECDAGRHLAGLGLWADVEYCAQQDISNTVPRLACVGGDLVLTPLG